jgi:hypothetical protein
MAFLNAASVFSGALAENPRWAMIFVSAEISPIRRRNNKKMRKKYFMGASVT